MKVFTRNTAIDGRDREPITMLQFMDCSNCGKRVRTTAVLCHHCQQPLVSGAARKPVAPNQVAPKPSPHSSSQTAHSNPNDHDDDESSQAHYALSGGYDTEDDDFDYDEFVANEFPDPASVQRSSVKPWIWITAWILVAATLLPFVFYFLVG